MMRRSALGILHSYVLSTLSTLCITYLVIIPIMINEIKRLVHFMSLLPPLVVHFRSYKFFPTKTVELEFFRLCVYESCDFFKTVQ